MYADQCDNQADAPHVASLSQGDAVHQVQGPRLLLKGLSGATAPCLRLSRPLAQETGKLLTNTRTTVVTVHCHVSALRVPTSVSTTNVASRDPTL